jgi:hypothetical protein
MKKPGWLISIVLTLCALPLLEAQRSSCPQGFHTLYSKKATTLDPAFTRPVRLTSPDGKKLLSVRIVEDSHDPDGLHISYRVRFAGKTRTTELPGFNGEIAWSPDSKAFAVTQTEGGGGLGSRVYVFFVGEAGLTKLDVSEPIEKDFGNPVKCEPASIKPNTGFVRWGQDSSSLLAAAEIVNVSVCDCMGTYRVYEINLPALTVRRAYSQTEAKKLFWTDLGCELRGADDRCVSIVEDYARKRRDPR